MINNDDLKKMSETDITQIDKNSLVDVSKILVDSDQPVEIRMEEYLNQIKNPYCFLCGNTPVKIEYSEIGCSLDETLINHFIDSKQD